MLITTSKEAQMATATKRTIERVKSVVSEANYAQRRLFELRLLWCSLGCPNYVRHRPSSKIV